MPNNRPPHHYYSPYCTPDSEEEYKSKTAALDSSVNSDSDTLDTFTRGQSLDKVTRYFYDGEAFATILYKLAVKKYGEEFKDWESDTVILALKEDFPSIPAVNLDKILALVSLENAMDGRLNFFNEVNCFRHTVDVLNNMPTNYEFLGGLVPQHICWTIYEIDKFMPGYKLDEDPLKFTALSFHINGYLIFPDCLIDYQEFLNSHNKNTELVDHIKEVWKKHRTTPIDALDEDDLVEMQILMLRSIEDYVNFKKETYLQDLTHYLN